MKTFPMLVAAAFAVVSFGALAVPKAAETPDGTVVPGAANAPAPKLAAKKAAKKPAKKPVVKKAKKKM